jgi:hypothetical protein
MQDKNRLIGVALIAVCAFSIVIAISSFRSLKKMELEFNEKKATLVKENLELKDRIDSIQQMVAQKTEAAGVFDKEKKIIENQLKSLKDENEKLIFGTNEHIDTLKRKNAILKKRVASLENSPIVQRIKEAIQVEDNDNVKEVLADAVNKIEMVMAGKSVSLEPIVVTKIQQTGAVSSVTAEGKTGVILSIDKKTNLIVINLGRKDDVKEGDRCKIFKNDLEIARAQIINIRYRISAAFVDDIKYKYTINDIGENQKVIIETQ